MKKLNLINYLQKKNRSYRSYELLKAEKKIEVQRIVILKPAL